MKGFKDSTKTQYTTGSGCGPKGAAKTSQVMAGFKSPVKKAAGGIVGRPATDTLGRAQRPVPLQRRPEDMGGPAVQRLPRR